MEYEWNLGLGKSFGIKSWELEKKQSLSVHRPLVSEQKKMCILIRAYSGTTTVMASRFSILKYFNINFDWNLIESRTFFSTLALFIYNWQ